MQESHKLIRMAFFDRNLLSSSSSLHLGDQCTCFPDNSKEVFPVMFPEKAKSFAVCHREKDSQLLTDKSPSSPQDIFHPRDSIWVEMTHSKSCFTLAKPRLNPSLPLDLATNSEGTEQNQSVTTAKKHCGTFSFGNHFPPCLLYSPVLSPKTTPPHCLFHSQASFSPISLDQSN